MNGTFAPTTDFPAAAPFLPTPTSLARCKPSMPAGFEHDPGRREGGDNPCGRAEPLTLPESSRTNADDRLPRAPLGRVEGGDSFVEGRDVADVRPQPSVTHTPDDLGKAAVFLASDDSAYVNGIELFVDGGAAQI